MDRYCVYQITRSLSQFEILATRDADSSADARINKAKPAALIFGGDWERVCRMAQVLRLVSNEMIATNSAAPIMDQTIGKWVAPI